MEYQYKHGSKRVHTLGWYSTSRQSLQQLHTQPVHKGPQDKQSSMASTRKKRNVSKRLPLCRYFPYDYWNNFFLQWLLVTKFVVSISIHRRLPLPHPALNHHAVCAITSPIFFCTKTLQYLFSFFYCFKEFVFLTENLTGRQWIQFFFPKTFF